MSFVRPIVSLIVEYMQKLFAKLWTSHTNVNTNFYYLVSSYTNNQLFCYTTRASTPTPERHEYLLHDKKREDDRDKEAGYTDGFWRWGPKNAGGKTVAGG